MKTVEIKGKKYKVTDKSPKYRAEMVRILIDGGMLVRGPYYVRFSEGDPVPFMAGLVDSANTHPVIPLCHEKILENPGCFKVLKECEWPDSMDIGRLVPAVNKSTRETVYIRRISNDLFSVIANEYREKICGDAVFKRFTPFTDRMIDNLKIGYKGDGNEN